MKATSPSERAATTVTTPPSSVIDDRISVPLPSRCRTMESPSSGKLPGSTDRRSWMRAKYPEFSDLSCNSAHRATVHREALFSPTLVTMKPCLMIDAKRAAVWFARVDGTAAEPLVESGL